MKPTQTIILTTTGEYPILPNLTLIQRDHKTILDNSYTVYATTSSSANLEEAWKTIQDKVQGYIKLSHIGDDDYYDYFPDLLNQYLQLAYQKSLEDYYKAYKQIQEDPFIRDQYGKDKEGPIDNYLNTPKFIQEILTPFINH